jgi:chromosome partitioning protein
LKVLAFFNTLAGMGKTSLVYHLAWMFSEIGQRVLVADLDPQSRLTRMFLDEFTLAELWAPGRGVSTANSAAHPIEVIPAAVALLPGDPLLVNFGPGEPLHALQRVVRKSAEQWDANIVLISAAAGSGALARCAVGCANHVIVPTAADLLSVRCMEALGEQMKLWELPHPLGYVLTERGGQDSLIAVQYHKYVLRHAEATQIRPASDPNCLGVLERYRSLAPLALHSRKPMFFLKPADGAIGAHVEAVRDCYGAFNALAERILYSIV